MKTNVTQLNAKNNRGTNKFELTWRCKGIGDGAVTINELAMQLEHAAKKLREMAKDGVQLSESISEDYASLVTNDEVCASKYGMHRLEQ
jgi:hypothetical protein